MKSRPSTFEAKTAPSQTGLFGRARRCHRNSLCTKVLAWGSSIKGYIASWMPNFLTRNYYPVIPHLSGNQLPSLLSENGVWKTLLKAGELAAAHPSGRCCWSPGSILITKAEDIQQVLIGEARAHKTDKNESDKLSRHLPFGIWTKFFGELFFAGNGDVWKHGRNALKKTIFHQVPLQIYEERIHLVVDQFIEQLKEKASEDKALNLDRLLGEFTLDVAGKVFMNCDGLSDAILNRMPLESKTITGLLEPWGQLKWELPSLLRNIVFLGKDTNFLKQSENLKQAVRKYIYEPNKENIESTDNLVKELWKAEYHHGKAEEQIPKEIPFEEVYPLLSAVTAIGSDTIKTTVQFVIKLLAKHPKIEEKLREELKRVVCDTMVSVDGEAKLSAAQEYKGQDFNINMLNKVDYLDQVIKEAMRLFPSAGIIARGVDESFTLLDYKELNISKEKRQEMLHDSKRDKTNDLVLPPGTTIFMSPFLTQRSNKFKNPHEFDPENFSPENEAKISKYDYFPFSQGPQDCIGKRIAMNEVKMLVAAIYLNFHPVVENVDDFELAFRGVTLQPKNPPMVRFVPLCALENEMQKGWGLGGL